MSAEINLNIEKLVATVVTHRLLFYPVMMHIIASSLRRRDENNGDFYLAYVFAPEKGNAVINKICWYPEFDVFFSKYVQNCYKSMQNILNAENDDKNAVLISCQNKGSLAGEILFDRKIYLSMDSEQKNMNLQFDGFSNNPEIEKLQKDLQQRCDLFMDDDR